MTITLDVAGLSYGEAARALRQSEGTVTRHVYRARPHVAQRLRHAAPTPPSAQTTTDECHRLSRTRDLRSRRARRGGPRRNVMPRGARQLERYWLVQKRPVCA
jgi:hypothetical protein